VVVSESTPAHTTVAPRRQNPVQRTRPSANRNEENQKNRELTSLRTDFDKDMADFNRMSAQYTASIRKIEADYTAQMKAAKNAYHKTIALGGDPVQAKNVRKTAEAKALKKHDSKTAALANSTKPKLEQLKDRIRKTSARIAELEGHSTSARRSRR